MLWGYRPLLQERRSATLHRKRHEYQVLRREIFDSSLALLKSSSSSWDPLGEGKEAETLSQIRRDLPRLVLRGSASDRTVAELERLLHDPRLQALMERVLFVWSVRQPASGYVQGHHDVMIPLLLVFLAASAGVGVTDGQLGPATLDAMPEGALQDVEADCFWCLAKVLSEVADYYTEGQPGLQRAAGLLRVLLATADAELLEGLEAEGVDTAAVVVRWLGCLMVRELPIALCLRLWDTCIAESALASGSAFGDFLVHFCAHFLASHAGMLRGAPFDVWMAFVQQPATESLDQLDLDALISGAYALRAATNGRSQLQASSPDALSSTIATSGSSTSTPTCSCQTSESGDLEDAHGEDRMLLKAPRGIVMCSLVVE